MATPTVAVHPAHNQPQETFPPIFFSTEQLRVLSDMCVMFGGDSSNLNLVKVPGGAMWIPR
jgi:hypothetical protein